MRVFVLLFLLLGCLTTAGSAFAEEVDLEIDEGAYMLSDGDTLLRGQAAFSIYGGYPQSSLAYIAAPWHYVNLGVEVDVSYEPAFSMGVPLEVQFLESEDESLNLSLTLLAALFFNFDGSLPDPEMLLRFDPGFSSGWRFHRLAGWFLSGHYALNVPISVGGAFSHHPSLASGFEVRTPSIVNVILKATVDFTDYDPDRFVYGGALGLGFSLW